MKPLALVQMEVGQHLERISKLFKSGAKLTLLVRQPDHDDQDFMMTNDDLADAAKVIARVQRRRAAETKVVSNGD